MRRFVSVVVLAALLVAGAPSAARATSHACPDPTKLPPTPFTDLRSATHRSGVVCAAWYGVVNGTSTSHFSPRQAVRRDQMASFLARLLVAADAPLPTRPPQPFADAGATVHGPAIAQVAELGLVEGVADGIYDPAGQVTRGQVAAFLVRLAALLGVEAADAPDPFPDDDGTTHEAAINAAVALRLVRGRDDGTYGSGVRLTREQMASLLGRMIRVLVHRGVMKPRPIPAFASAIAPVPDEMRRRMTGATWHRGCPVPIDRLVLLRATHWDYRAMPRRGYLIVARPVAADVRGVLRRLYRERFQIQRMRPVHLYPGGEEASLLANNTSAFNCRRVTGGSGWSQHSYGTAIDINPRQNPYVRGDTVLPPNAGPWVARTPVRRGMIVGGDSVTSAFSAIGWGWGGDYRSLKDWQHFSASGG